VSTGSGLAGGSLSTIVTDKGGDLPKTVASVVMTCLLSVSALAVAQQPQTAGAAKPTAEEALKALRADLQSSRADVVAKNMTLSAEQAAKFWPLFEQYQKEQNVIMDEQLKGIQKYVESYEAMDDASAVALMNAHFDRDARMNALRQKYLGEFQKVLPTKLAVRAMQIDRRLALATQMEMASHIPLAH
jgi:Spy/CpxP family protein refolding chaperone